MSLILPFHPQTYQHVQPKTKTAPALMYVSAQVFTRVLLPSHVFDIEAKDDGGLAQAERIYSKTLCFLHSLKD